MKVIGNGYLRHSGTPQPYDNAPVGSGRYRKGSGEHPYQRYHDFYTEVLKLKNENPGITDRELAERMGVYNRYHKPDTSMFRIKYSNAQAEVRAARVARVVKLKEEGYSTSEIGRMIGKNESTVRSMLDENAGQKRAAAKVTADALKEYVDRNRYVDVGAGTEYAFGVNNTRFKNAIGYLQEDGYKLNEIKIDQMGTNHKTTILTLTPPDVDYSELVEHRFDIKSPIAESRMFDANGEVSSLGLTKPVSVSSDRIKIDYSEDTGLEGDGRMYIRRGTSDITLGGSSYAQVRIAVDDTHYLKGMALYSDNLPDGVDILFSTNKSNKKPMLDNDSADKDGGVLKPMKVNKASGEIDWENPFGASVSQITLSNGQTSPVCIVNKEGEWQGWGKSLPPQFLTKQPEALAKRQLDISYNDKRLELDEIKSLTNQSIKKKFLMSFADKCNANAVDLKAAPFPGQQSHVILPFAELKDNEIYAPNYPDGTRVALIRYPHGGKFEIPELTVRNTGSPAANYIRNAPDAVGINARVAERLSGADFDGDTVTVIPLSDKVRVQTQPALEGLKNFDPKSEYAYYPGMDILSKKNTQIEMGKVSNLITDMTLKGAGADDIAKAVRHSMVVIDANKHKLDWKRSEKENDIQRLKDLYQNGGGASTIISRAKSPEPVKQRKDTFDIVDGKKVYRETNETVSKARVKGMKDDVYINFDKEGKMFYLEKDSSTGKKIRRYVTEDDLTSKGVKTTFKTQDSTKMAEIDDAFKLTSGGSKENPGYRIEKIYANYANQMKALAVEALREYQNTTPQKRNPEAAKRYSEEVASLNKKLAESRMNAPKERQAQLLANRTMDIRKKANPDMTSDEIKKYKGQAINAARDMIGAKKPKIDISDKEWEAIQAHAVSPSVLEAILDNADMDKLRERATPRAKKTITPSMRSLAKSMERSGYSTSQIADRLGISASSVYAIVSK